MAVVDGSWSECSDDSWYEIVNDDEDVEVIGYDDDHKDFWNGEGIVDSFVKLDYDLEDSKSLVNVTKLFSTSNVIKTVDDSGVTDESKQAHEEEETKIEELLMGATRCSHSRPDHQVISQLNKAMETKKPRHKKEILFAQYMAQKEAEQKEIKAKLKQLKKKEKKRGASDTDSSNNIISCINGIDLKDENMINMVIAATVILASFSFSNLGTLIFLSSLATNNKTIKYCGGMLLVYLALFC